MTWKINREAFVLLAGPRALLLQIAHPGIAAGVFEHSDWRAHPWRRLWNTLWLMSQVIFSRPAASRKALQRINAAHRPVKGIYYSQPETKPRHYSAHDPELSFWVIATLIDSSVYAHERWGTAIDSEGLETYYQESLKLTPLFGLNPALPPQNWRAFQHYFDEILNSGALCSTQVSSQLTHAILNRNKALSPFVSSLAASSLPESVRLGFNLPWTEAQELKWRRIDGAIRRYVQNTPLWMRENPVALLARLKT